MRDTESPGQVPKRNRHLTAGPRASHGDGVGSERVRLNDTAARAVGRERAGVVVGRDAWSTPLRGRVVWRGAWVRWDDDAGGEPELVRADHLVVEKSTAAVDSARGFERAPTYEGQPPRVKPPAPFGTTTPAKRRRSGAFRRRVEQLALELPGDCAYKTVADDNAEDR